MSVTQFMVVLSVVFTATTSVCMPFSEAYTAIMAPVGGVCAYVTQTTGTANNECGGYGWGLGNGAGLRNKGKGAQTPLG